MKATHVFVLCGVVLASSAFCSGAEDAQKKNIDEFTAHYFDDVNVADYIRKIDALIDKVDALPVTPPAPRGGPPKDVSETKSENGIVMLYSLDAIPPGLLYHFSISRPPYLATPLGMNILALFGERLGLSSSTPMVQVSANRVFHIFWLIPADRAEQEKADAAKRRLEARKTADLTRVFLSAEMKGAELLKNASQPPTPKSQPAGK